MHFFKFYDLLTREKIKKQSNNPENIITTVLQLLIQLVSDLCCACNTITWLTFPLVVIFCLWVLFFFKQKFVDRNITFGQIIFKFQYNALGNTNNTLNFELSN